MPKFKVMTWNVENLFQFGEESSPKTEVEYTQKLQSLAQVILQLEPDVLGLQEIGSSAALNDLVELLQNRYPHMQISDNPDPRGIRVGFLSKLEIKEHEEIVEFPESGLPTIPGIDSHGNLTEVTRLSRGALRILVEPKQDFSLNVIVTHLKSKLLSFPKASGRSGFDPKDENERARVAGLALLKRTAEAVALRVKSNELLEGNDRKALILLGDLNDVTNAATTQILNGPAGSEIGTTGFDRPDRGDDTRLFNLAPLIPAERRFSRINQGNKELIDHILVSQELLPGQPRQVPTVDNHIDVFGALPSVGTNPATRRGEPASDHAPISATFDL
ncbi:MAG: endonuclease/exonuclease/phosphatase family protein [Microcystis sp. LE19-338.1B]|jgi:endonuclease/exonuclease/phosphatase family metal-dependent hydrolase|nr:endonuclease/exonuclease/phosphatase family protein [Microcystis sp. LE19-338.1B]